MLRTPFWPARFYLGIRSCLILLGRELSCPPSSSRGPQRSRFPVYGWDTILSPKCWPASPTGSSLRTSGSRYGFAVVTSMAMLWNKRTLLDHNYIFLHPQYHRFRDTKSSTQERSENCAAKLARLFVIYDVFHPLRYHLPDYTLISPRCISRCKNS